jgi:cytoskeletal protein CcmA (bactofilin family)
MSESRERAGVIGAGLVVMGRLRGEGDMRVEGVLEGEIDLDGDVSLGATSNVVAPVRGRSVEIEGELVGRVTAERDLTVRSGGRVRGDVRAARLAIDDGAVIDGMLDMAFDLGPGGGR